MKKVCILGAQGMLGQALYDEFSIHGYEVVAWNKSNLDITKPELCKEKLTMLCPDILINAAAYNAVDKIEEDKVARALALQINGNAPEMLARIAKEMGSIFVHFSSDYVFDGQNKDGYAEDAPISPVNVYAKTKLKGEQAVQNVGGLFYLIRLSRLFGKSGIGKNIKKSFVDIMLSAVRDKGKMKLNLVDEERSCPTYAPDLAMFVRALITDAAPFDLYHGANTGACTWYGFAKEIFAEAGMNPTCVPVSSKEFSRPAARPMYSELLNTKRPKQRQWQEALQEYLIITKV